MLAIRLIHSVCACVWMHSVCSSWFRVFVFRFIFCVFYISISVRIDRYRHILLCSQFDPRHLRSCLWMAQYSCTVKTASHPRNNEHDMQALCNFWWRKKHFVLCIVYFSDYRYLSTASLLQWNHLSGKWIFCDKSVNSFFIRTCVRMCV